RMASSLSILGIALGVSTLVLGSFFEDTVDYVLKLQFEKAQRQDVTLTFNETLSSRALHDVGQLPGVIAIEPFRSVPVRVRRGNQRHRLGLMGLDKEPQLYRVLDDQERSVNFPVRSGLTISQKLAEILEVDLGDSVEVDVLDRRRTTIPMTVASIFPNFTDPAAFLNRGQLHRILQEGPQYSGVFLSVDPLRMDDLYREVKRIPTVAGLLDKNAAKKNLESTISESTAVMRFINGFFSITIALGVIYNCAIIILAERARDLTTLRVMGFRRREVLTVLLGELAVLTILAIPVGLPIGYCFAWYATLALDTETHRFPFVIERSTYVYATSVILVASSFSAIYVKRMLGSLDLVSVLKVKA
ncbi:MAG: FtsX-like permease family protein, partial [Planctomycetota bacterium]